MRLHSVWITLCGHRLATKATVLWVSTTPVPTDPPPQPGKNPAGGDNCTLVPGRLEVDVLRCVLLCNALLLLSLRP